MVWSGIYPPTPGKACDLCKSEEDVNNVMVKVSHVGCVKSLFSHVQSNLCNACKEKSWIIFGEADVRGNITYYNLHTQEFKYSK